MKTTKKALLLTLCAVLLVAATVVGTMAYLTDSEKAVNTFTVGKVYIDMDEAKVNEDGAPVAGADRVKENKYHLLPGHTYVKDPTVTVEAGSEDAYVRMLVTLSYSSQLDAIFAPTGADMMTIFNGYDNQTWLLHDVTEDVANNTRTYEFRYKNVVAKSTTETKLEPLFTSITVPGFISNAQLATLVTLDDAGEIVDQFTITVVAHAIQADGFDSAEQAWANFS